MKYCDQVADWLVELGYTHCFYVGGGNIMHLLESFSRKLDCRAVIHEVAAGIAAEYFNESASDGKKAVALVTAGPGLTNLVTAMAGAFLESRELLVIGGQVKTPDLARGALRQRGIQEIDGVAIVAPVSVKAVLMDAPVDFEAFSALTGLAGSNRKGPVFIEMPLDVQARNVDFEAHDRHAGAPPTASMPKIDDTALQLLAGKIRIAKRPTILLGGGVSRQTASALREALAGLSMPVTTTWNASDRIDADAYNYAGRPNTWGQRSANLVMQQSDLLIAIGTRLGMQQTGFNWQQFVPNGEVVQVEIDAAELNKGHPRVAMPLLADANDFLPRLLALDLGQHHDWLAFARKIRNALPVVDPVNVTRPGFISPFAVADRLSDLCSAGDVIIPCSSGGAFTVMMQTFRQKAGQVMITNKGLAAMGYGLSGAIGAAFSDPARRVVLVEGDGGFAQNLQEIGTAAVNNLNLKIFIFDDGGYASIRMTQRNYFSSGYIGCDRQTGLGLPDWEKLFAAWGVPTMRIDGEGRFDQGFQAMFDQPGVAAFIVSIDADQTYFPKITSRMTESGTMESNPLHLMTPDLSEEQYRDVVQFL